MYYFEIIKELKKWTDESKFHLLYAFLITMQVVSVMYYIVNLPVFDIRDGDDGWLTTAFGHLIPSSAILATSCKSLRLFLLVTLHVGEQLRLLQ